MRWLKNTIFILLLLAAAGVVLVTALSDHSDDYGQVSLPQGGVVELPKGTVTVYFSQLGDNSDPVKQLSGPLSFQVVPAGGAGRTRTTLPPAGRRIRARRTRAKAD